MEEFKKTHIPADDEPCKNYELSEIDSAEIRKISLRMSIEKDYKSTTYHGTRKDGSKYIVAQVGDNGINEKKYYRYFYADESKDGKLTNQTIVYSDTNVAQFIDDRKFGRDVSDGYEEAVVNVLFSKENIRDSLSKGTYYIGKVEKDRKDNIFELVSDVSEISKSEREQQLFKFPTKQFIREDGNGFVVQQMGVGQYENMTLYRYHIFEPIKENGIYVIKRNIVYTEKDFLKDNRKGIANDYLSRDRLDRKVGEAGGYIGYYDDNEIRRYNPELIQYFRTTESANIWGKQESRPTTNKNPKLTAEQLKRKKQWVSNFIKDYDDTESEVAYGVRTAFEDRNKHTVLESIKQGKFIGIFDNGAQSFDEKSAIYMGKVMTAMARLLKEADNLTIDGGMDYLERFMSIPEVDKLLLQLRDSEETKQTHMEAEENRKLGKLPNFPKTLSEIDKKYAQEYLRSGNLSQSSIQEEINYRRALTSRSIINVSSEIERKNIPKLRRQQISLTRVLARQDGKTPSDAMYDKEAKRWYCITDTKRQQSKTQDVQEAVASSIDTNYITLESIKRDTSMIGLQEINDVIKDIKQTQNQRDNQEQEYLR